MICAFLLFCSLVFSNPEVTLYPGSVSFIEPNIIAAHDYLDGKYFYDLQVGDEVLYKADTWKRYEVEGIERFRANDASMLSYVYASDLVLITCIAKNDNPTWGRLVVRLEEICPLNTVC